MLVLHTRTIPALEIEVLLGCIRKHHCHVCQLFSDISGVRNNSNLTMASLNCPEAKGYTAHLQGSTLCDYLSISVMFVLQTQVYPR